MILRKINAILGLGTTFMLLRHAIFHAVWMLSKGAVTKTASSVTWILVWMMAAHAILSIILAILGHKGAEKRECKSYPGMNRATIIQRASGVALILFTALHIGGTAGPLKPPQVVHAILPPLFFTGVLMHTAISASKALITLGVGNAKVVKVADIVIKILCVATLIADVAGFYLFVC